MKRLRDNQLCGYIMASSGETVWINLSAVSSMSKKWSGGTSICGHEPVMTPLQPQEVIKELRRQCERNGTENAS